MKPEYFTPLNATRSKRWMFKRSDIVVIDGGLDVSCVGWMARIRADRIEFDVYGCECSLPDCACDAYIVPTNQFAKTRPTADLGDIDFVQDLTEEQNIGIVWKEGSVHEDGQPFCQYYGSPSRCLLFGKGHCSNDGNLWGSDDALVLACTEHSFPADQIDAEFYDVLDGKQYVRRAS